VIEQRKEAIGYTEPGAGPRRGEGEHRRCRNPLQPGARAKMFENAGRAADQLARRSTSEIKVSALIAEDELELAVRVLHTAFGLDEQSAAA
jgi:aspartate kinase